MEACRWRGLLDGEREAYDELVLEGLEGYVLEDIVAWWLEVMRRLRRLEAQKGSETVVMICGVRGSTRRRLVY